jgi:hypothetical protein
MADLKISQLTGATTPLAGTEVLPIVQSSSTKKVTVADLTTGRAISATQLTLTTGNLIVANGQGIDFSLTPGTGTSELLNDYEEGIWTPGFIFDGGNTGITYNVQVGTYTKIGNRVFFQGRVTLSSKGVDVGSVFIDGLPFTTNATANYIGAYSVQMNNLAATVLTPLGSIIENVNVLQLTQLVTGSNVPLTDADFLNNTAANFSGQYLV